MVPTITSRAVRVFLLLAFLFVFFVSMIPPTSGYERTVFQGVPNWLLVYFFATMVLGAALLAWLSLEYNARQFYCLCIGMLIAFFGFFYIPYSRGYFLNSGYNADTLVHLGIVKNILESGVLPVLTYPGTHNIITTIHLLTGIQLNDLPWLISVIFFALFISSIVLCVRTLTGNQKLTVLITCASFTVLFAKYRYEVMPWMYAVPFIFLLAANAKHHLESSRHTWLLMFMVVTLALTIYHPFTAFYGAIFLFSYIVVHSASDRTSIGSNKGLVLPFAFGVVVLSYHLFLETIASGLASSLAQLISNKGGPGAKVASQAAIFSYTVPQYLSRFILPLWGDIIYYLSFGGITTVIILFGWYRNESSPTVFEKFLASQYMLGGILASGLLVTGFFASSIRRVSQYGILISILLVGVGLYKTSTFLQSRLVGRLKVLVVLVILIAPVMVGSAATMYAPDRHVTEKAATGSEWQFENTDLTHPHISDPPGRIAIFHFGNSETWRLKHQGYHVEPIRDHPDRLGYKDHSTISDALNNSQSIYLVTKTRDREWYHWEPEWRWGDLRYYTDQDYNQLRDDRSAERVYANGGFEIWIVETTD